MASHIWIGGAPAIAQIDLTTVPSDVEAGQTVNFTIGNKTLPVVLAGTTLAEVVAELVAAWNASTIPEFFEVTAAVGSTAGTFTLTSKTAGKPFAVSVSIGSGNNEVQVVTLGGTAATGGTFTLTFNSETTTTIAYNASAATVQSALEGLASYSSGDFAVTGSNGGPWTVTFTGTLAGTNVSLMTIDVTSLTGAVNEVQTISSPSNPTGGTFTLKFGSQTTAPIAYNASAATIQAALILLSNIPSGSVACSGGALPGTPVTVTFQDELAATDVSLLVVDATSLTGVTGSAVETQAGGSSLADKTVNFWEFESGVSNSPNYDLTDAIASAVLTGGSYFTIGSEIVSGGISGNCLYSDGYLGAFTAAADKTVAKFDEASPFTLSLWVKPSSTGGDLLVWRGTSSTTVSVVDYSVETIYNSGSDGGTVKFKVKKSGGFHTVTSSDTLTLNVWNLITAIWDPDNTQISVGINGSTLATTSSLTVGTVTASSTSYLGLLEPASASWEGYIDSLGVFNQALSLAETQIIYNSGSGDDYPFPTDNNNEVQTLTLSGSPSAGVVTVSYQGVGVDIPYDATAAEAEALLDTVSTIGSGNTNVTGGDWPGTALVVEFINDLAFTNVELLEVDIAGLTMSVAETTKGVTAPTGSVETTVSPLTKSTSTASEGPNHWDTSENWNSNTVPETGDTVYIGDTNVSILYGLDQSAITLAALNIEQTFTGDIGLPRLNTDGATAYSEYRDQYLKIGATLLNIGDKQGDGSERIKINLGSVQTTVLITNSGDSPDGNTPAILLLGTHASNVININRGILGVAYYPTEVATVATLRQAFFDNAADDTTVYLGSGVTVTDIVKSGGVLDVNSATTTFKQSAGTTTIHAGAHAVLNILAGLLNYNSTGTLSAVNLSGDGVLVFDQDARPKTVTVIDKYTDDSEIYDESGSIASPVIDLNNCGDLSTLHMGQDFKLTFGATT